MADDERCRTVDLLTKIVNDEMGLREQLEIIRILNPDAHLKRTDTQFVIGKHDSSLLYKCVRSAEAKRSLLSC